MTPYSRFCFIDVKSKRFLHEPSSTYSYIPVQTRFCLDVLPSPRIVLLILVNYPPDIHSKVGGK